MPAREHMERLETAAEGPGHHLDRFTRRAAVLVAVLAGLLAVATLLSNEAVKESINSETRAADAHTLYETNEVKAFVSRGDSRELQLLAEGASELAMVALEIAIVLTSIAIITHLGWLVGGGVFGGLAGVALILSGLAL